MQKTFMNTLHEKPFTTAEFCNVLGKTTLQHAPHPEKSFVACAHEYDLPLYVSTLKDSSLALNLAVHRLRGKTYNVDIAREILEQGAIVQESKGIVELGGGVPKNTAQQTGPLLDQILRRGHGGQEYIVQITVRAQIQVDSLVPPYKIKSWGKVQSAHSGMVTVYADATIAFPILALYVISGQKKWV